jgi:transcriptional regulator with XRE-family HTH domain
MMTNLGTDVNSAVASDMPILPAQCRGARAMLGLEQGQIAKLALVSRNTVADFESGKRTPTRANVQAIQDALERSGVEFIEENGGGPGVRLRKGKT